MIEFSVIFFILFIPLALTQSFECKPVDLSKQSCQQQHRIEGTCSQVCYDFAFSELVSFAFKYAYIGAVICENHISGYKEGESRCSCFFPGLSKCRSQKFYDKVQFVGDHAMRQLSRGWRIAAKDDHFIEDVILKQQTRLLAHDLSRNQARNASSDLCRPDISHEFDERDRKSDEGTPLQSYTPAFRRSEVGVPSPRRRLIAVFNFGMNLLGGYVDPERWKSDGLVNFVSRVQKRYKAVLEKTVQWLRGLGFQYIIFKSTNAISINNLYGDWKISAETCSLSATRFNSTLCDNLVEVCVSLYGPEMAHACRFLSFDSAGVTELNALSLSKLVSIDSSKAETAEFFPQSDKALVDGYLDSFSLTRWHPECSSTGGRFYSLLELVNARIISDAIQGLFNQKRKK